MAVTLSAGQRLVCERVLNAFETGSAEGDYGNVTIYEDGPNDIRQITYGRSQTTEYGNLRELVRMYSEAGGKYSGDLAPYLPRIGREALVNDSHFISLLRRAGDEDPVMKQTQDVFFDRRYFQPAMEWADANGFTLALSALVIYDSFIQSGGILDFLRARFPERPPAAGGDERTWIAQYVEVRHNWLLNHHRPAVRASAYRTRDLRREAARGNWDLAMLPVNANGVLVDDTGASGMAAPSAAGLMAATAAEAGADDDIPFLGDPETFAPVRTAASPAAKRAMPLVSALEAAGGGLMHVFGEHGDDSSAPALANAILSNPNITLATVHASGVSDQANARQNMTDTAAGLHAQRSSYGTAPGGTVPLDERLLHGLIALAGQYRFSVSEIAGGSHSANSRHYAGVAADFNVINGHGVSASNPDVPAFKNLCRTLGATEVLGPGDPGHGTHVHAAWPRPV
ncbi:MAG: chitosanase [Verrucomicrobiaceae bacterium]|nr:chitosanase [Verrucomicrobiaceae bacterium]